MPTTTGPPDLPRLSTVVLILTSILLGTLRVLGEKHLAFQAVSHLFVGGLYATYFADRTQRPALILAVLLSALELGCFIADFLIGRLSLG